MAKAPAAVEEVEEVEVEEVDETEAEAAITPKSLAEELEISPKALRAFLRRKFPRGNDHGKSWTLTDDQIEAARKNWSETPDEDEEDEDAEVEA